MKILFIILSFFFYVPVKLIQWVVNKRRIDKIPPESVYYFVGVWVAHQINDDQYQSSFYSLWIKKDAPSIPIEKEIKHLLIQFGLQIINFKVISISEWTKNDYDTYIKGEVEDNLPPITPGNEEVDYQTLIDQAVTDENYEEAARLKKLLEKKNSDAPGE